MFADRHARLRWFVTRTPVALVLAVAAGLVLTVPALAKSAAETAAESAAPVAGTPCTANASACVDVNKKQAWLIKDGKIMRGPVPIATGGPGKETLTGNVFRVYRKDKEFKSDEFKLPNGQPAPMPNAVFFEDGGVAFHAGNPKLASAGCVHLTVADSLAFFDYLQIGDHVQVMDGPVAAKPLSADQIATANGEDTSNDTSNSDSTDGGSDSSSNSDNSGNSDSGDSTSRDSKTRNTSDRSYRASSHYYHHYHYNN